MRIATIQQNDSEPGTITIRLTDVRSNIAHAQDEHGHGVFIFESPEGHASAHVVGMLKTLAHVIEERVASPEAKAVLITSENSVVRECSLGAERLLASVAKEMEALAKRLDTEPLREGETAEARQLALVAVVGIAPVLERLQQLVHGTDLRTGQPLTQSMPAPTQPAGKA